MRLRIVFYRPDWQKLHAYPTEVQSMEMFKVSFHARIVNAEQYEVMADVSIDPSTFSHEEILENTFRQTQNDFYKNGWRWALLGEGAAPCRSSMIGDLFALDDEWYVMDRVGFRHLTTEELQRVAALR